MRGLPDQISVALVKKRLTGPACAVAFLLAALAPAHATVTGGVTCPPADPYSTFVVDIEGEIGAATVEAVRKLFEDFHKHENDPSKCEVSAPDC